MEKEKELREVQPPPLPAIEDVDDGMRFLDHYQQELHRLSQRSRRRGRKDTTAVPSSSSIPHLLFPLPRADPPSTRPSPVIV